MPKPFHKQYKYRSLTMNPNIINPNAVMPDWLINLCLGNNNGGKNIAVPRPSTSGGFAVGSRNTYLTSLAGTMRKQGADEETIFKNLTAINNAQENPLPDYEIRSISKSICRYDVALTGLTHDSFADYLAKDLAGIALYCAGVGFYTYDKTHWSKNTESLFVLHKARELSNKICDDVLRMRGPCEEKEYKRLQSMAQKTKSASFMKQSIELLKSDPRIAITLDKFDETKSLINFKNGTYNLETGQLQPHNSADKLTHILDFEYDAIAPAPYFAKLLSEILTVEQKEFILRLFGYALLGRGSEQKFVVFLGKGKNGKSTLIQAVESVLSSLVTTIQADSLSGKKDGQIRNDLAVLPNKRALFINESRAGTILDAPLIKQLTGQDKISARFLYGEYFSFQPICVPILVSNFMPVIDGADYAIERRMCVVMFEKVIEHVDLDLPHKLAQEKAGIFNLLIEGLADYKAKGLAIPDHVLASTKKYVEQSNLIKGFFADCLEPHPDSKLRANDLYWAYQVWCHRNGYKPVSNNTFKDSFERDTGLEQLRDAQGRYWSNLRRKLH